MKKFALVAMFFLLVIVITIISCASSKINNEINENFKVEYDTNVKMHAKIVDKITEPPPLRPSGILLEVPRSPDDRRPISTSSPVGEPGMRFTNGNYSALDDQTDKTDRTAIDVVTSGTNISKSKLNQDQSDNKAQVIDASRSVKGVIKYLYIPATGIDYSTEMLADTILRYINLLDIDLLVVSGKYEQLMNVAANLGVEFTMNWHASHIVSLCGQGLVFSKQDQKSSSGNPVVEFDDYTVLLYNLCSSQIDENDIFIGKEKTEARRKFNSIVSDYKSSAKPILAFVSPEETTPTDLEFSGINLKGAGALLSFDNELNSYGFVDLFDVTRYAAQSIGLQNPGYTYQSSSQKARIDFVYGRSVIPCESSIQMLPVLYDKNGVSRFAIIGSVAI